MNTAALRTLLIYAVILPLAIFIGWKVSDMTRASFAVLGAVALVLLLPVLLKWHYPILIFTWNTTITIFFLPGEPGLWMLVGGITFGMAILQRILRRGRAFLPAPSVAISLLGLALVVLVTATLRGGIGMRALGSDTYGGKGYIFIFAAIIGYFALTSQPISHDRAKLYIGLYFLSGVVPVFSNLIYLAGPSFYFLYLIFPVGYAGFQALSEYGGPVVRVGGCLPAANAILYYFMAVHGIRGILQKWWRPVLLLGALALGSLAGFRSLLFLVALTFLILFIAEGLLRSWVFPAMVLSAILGIGALAPFASKLPLATQRAISFLPIKVDPIAKYDAEGSLQWRLDMWRAMIPELPKYVWLGKGYTISPADLFLARESFRRGYGRSYETSIVAGDYHNGPLSVYVPFGIFGCLAALVFFCVSVRAVYLNYRYGRGELRTINRFLFSFFLAKVIVFFVVFGAVSSDLYQFVGVIGLSVALNRGICKRTAADETVVVPRTSGLALPAPGAA